VKGNTVTFHIVPRGVIDPEKALRAFVIGGVKDVQRFYKDGVPQSDIIKAAEKLSDAATKLGSHAETN
jgi:hypothetical protein